jgi:hypothetical protein
MYRTQLLDFWASSGRWKKVHNPVIQFLEFFFLKRPKLEFKISAFVISFRNTDDDGQVDRQTNTVNYIH